VHYYEGDNSWETLVEFLDPFALRSKEPPREFNVLNVRGSETEANRKILRQLKKDFKGYIKIVNGNVDFIEQEKRPVFLQIHKGAQNPHWRKLRITYQYI